MVSDPNWSELTFIGWDLVQSRPTQLFSKGQYTSLASNVHMDVTDRQMGKLVAGQQTVSSIKSQSQNYRFLRF